MLLHSKLHLNLLEKYLLDVCHISNRIPNKKNKISPYKIWKGRKRNIGYFRVWDC